MNIIRKRIVLTVSDKLKICQLVKGGKALQSVAEEYDVGKSDIVSAVSQNFNYPNSLIIRTPDNRRSTVLPMNYNTGYLVPLKVCLV